MLIIIRITKYKTKVVDKAKEKHEKIEKVKVNLKKC